MKIKAGELRTEAAPKPRAASPLLLKPLNALNAHIRLLSTQASVFTSIKKLAWCYFEISVISKEAFMEVLIDLLYIYFSIYMIIVNELIVTVV